MPEQELKLTISDPVSSMVQTVGSVIVAALGYGSAYRVTMSQENRDKYDALMIKGLERFDRWAEKIDGVLLSTGGK
jgi:hypothetical protein